MNATLSDLYLTITASHHSLTVYIASPLAGKSAIAYAARSLARLKTLAITTGRDCFESNISVQELDILLEGNLYYVNI